MGAVAMPRRKRHIFRWVFLGIQLLFLFWVIAGVAGNAGGQGAQAHAQALQYCAGGGWSPVFSSYSDCVTHYGNGLNAAADAGAVIGTGLVVALWAAADVILGMTWLVFVRPRWSKHERELAAYQGAQAALAEHARPYEITPQQDIPIHGTWTPPPR